MVGSSEYLMNPSPEKCQAWKERFLPKNDKDSTSSNGKKWDLRIVITYRRLHGYLPSYWNQRFKLFRSKKGNKSVGHQEWPRVNSDIRIPSFEEWFIKHYYNQPQKQLHLAQRSYNSWKACSNGITIVNTHKDEHLTTNLVCKGLNGATHTCSGLRKYDDQDHQRSRVKRRLRNRNASVNLDYDILPVFAYENGLVDMSPVQLRKT